MKFTIFYLFLSIFFALNVFSETKKPEVGIEEHLGQYLPEDLKFVNSTGESVLLKDIINKPTILSLVYYHCPGICSPLLTGLSDVVSAIELEPGKDFQVLSISFDTRENQETAAKWKKSYLSGMKRKIDWNAWLFMTGDSANIMKLTDAVGFYFKPDENGDFIHAASIYLISPQGKITRYLYGTKFLPFDLKMAIIEANSGNSQPTIHRVLDFCFSYDPQGRKYVFNVTKIVGVVSLFLVAVVFVVLVVKGRKRKDINNG